MPEADSFSPGPVVLVLNRLTDLLQGPSREIFEEQVLPGFLSRQRWFAGKGRALRFARIFKSTSWKTPAGEALWLAARVDYAEGPYELYQIPVCFAFESGAWPENASFCAAQVDGKPGHLIDALSLPALLDDLVQRMIGGPNRKPNAGPEAIALFESGDRLEAEVSPVLREAGNDIAARPLNADQSNSGAMLGSRFFMKFYRRLEAGVSPEAEMVRYLGETAHFTGTPAWRGELQLRPSGGEASALAIITDQVIHPVNAWDFLLASLRAASPDSQGAAWRKTLDLANVMGRRTAEMHAALGQGQSAAFASEPFAASEPARLAKAIAAQVELSLEDLARLRSGLSAVWQSAAETLLDRRESLLAPLQRLGEAPASALGLKIRTHGDFHLGQVLVHSEGVAILDFEGEPARSLAERRAKQSPLRDVAGMLRSLHYVSVGARLLPAGDEPVPAAALLENWHAAAQAAFTAGYHTSLAALPSQAGYAEGLLPTKELSPILLAAFILEKVAYELRYELHHRPDWVGIPLGGWLSLLQAKPA